MSRFAGFIIIVPLLLLGCAPSRPRLDTMQSNQAGLREDIRQLELAVEKTSGHIDELEKRISFLEGNITANIADLQRSVDNLSGNMEDRDVRTKKKIEDVSAELKAVSANVESRYQSVVAENKKLLQAIEEAKKSSFTTGYEHVVESGETLGEIARNYGVTVEVIVEANDLGDPDALRMGQTLFIPK